MQRQQAFKYRLNVRDERAVTHLSRLVGCCRFVWNRALALSSEKYLGYKALSALLPAWKEELAWLKEADSIALQQSLRHFDRAWQNFFKHPEHFKRPTFKKRLVKDSFRIVGAAAAKTEASKVWIPKFGWMTFRASRPWQGRVSSITVSRKARRWYVSLQCVVEVPRPAPRTDACVGVDVGVALYAAVSTGQKYASIKAFKRHQRKLARLQRRLARGEKGSKRRRKMQLRVAAMHHRISNIRMDHAHKVSTELVKNHGRIRMEDLRLVNMMKSARGTIENPGKQVAQKRGLSRHLADQGLRQFRTFVEYKLAWSGGTFESVNPRYTSQRCHLCKHVAADNRVSQADFTCVRCGHKDHADINAAKNIRDAAGGDSAVNARRGEGVGQPMKRVNRLGAA